MSCPHPILHNQMNTQRQVNIDIDQEKSEIGNLKHHDEYHDVLLEYRNAPRDGGFSSAEIVFGQPLRSLVPAHRRCFDNKWIKMNEQFD